MVWWKVFWVSQFGIAFFNSRGNGSGDKIAPVIGSSGSV